MLPVQKSLAVGKTAKILYQQKTNAGSGCQNIPLTPKTGQIHCYAIFAAITTLSFFYCFRAAFSAALPSERTTQ
jgi:hypothetical protein